MTSDYLEFTSKQELVLRAAYPKLASGTAPRAIVAHGATGGGKRQAILAAFVDWATMTRRRSDFVVIVPSSFQVENTFDRLREIAKTFGGFEGLDTQETQQWMRVESNLFHIYPYAIDYIDESRYIGRLSFRNFIPGGVVFLAADAYRKSFVEHVMTQIPEGPATLWASVDAGSTDNYWYEEYILKANKSDIVAVHFDLQDVSDNPGVSDRWREYMLNLAREEGASSELVSSVTGQWMPGPDSILSGFGEDAVAKQHIDAQLAHRERVAGARQAIRNPSPELMQALGDLTIRATIRRELPYPYIGYLEGDRLIEKIEEMLSSSRRELQDSGVDLVERAVGICLGDERDSLDTK